MSREFEEVPLIREVYLRIENGEKPYYSLRPFKGITSFPISGTTYHGNELENPKEDVVEMLKIGTLSYGAFQESVDVLYRDFLKACESRREDLLKTVVREAKELFFTEQSERLSLIGRELQRTVDYSNRDSRQLNPQHYTAADFSTVYAAVTGLHRAVQAAESSFDRLAIGTSVSSKDKYGKELYVGSPLELAEGNLKYLISQDSKMQQHFDKLREEYLKGTRIDAEDSVKLLRKRLKFEK